MEVNLLTAPDGEVHCAALKKVRNASGATVVRLLIKCDKHASTLECRFSRGPEHTVTCTKCLSKMV